MIDPKTLDKESLYLLQIKTLHQGKKQERQRIIKLLKENFGEFVDMPVTELEALIKGEQK